MSSPPKGNHTVTITNITSPDPLYSRIFHCDEDILEELMTLDCHGMHSITEHSLSHRNFLNLLAKAPYVQSKQSILFYQGI
jgi:hypothetical protein